eukprot:PhF_6_TR13584/c0_g1_i1/m.21727
MEAFLEKYANNMGKVKSTAVEEATSHMDPSIQWPPPGYDATAAPVVHGTARGWNRHASSPSSRSAAPDTIDAPRRRPKVTVCAKCHNRPSTVRCLDCRCDMCDLCHRHRHIGGRMATHQCCALRYWNNEPNFNEEVWETSTVTMKGAAHCRVCRRFVYKAHEAVVMSTPRMQIFFHPECHDSYFIGGNKFTKEYACAGVPFSEGVYKKPLEKFDLREEIQKAVQASVDRNLRARREDLTRPSCNGSGSTHVDYEDRPTIKYRPKYVEEQEDIGDFFYKYHGLVKNKLDT